MKINQNSHWGKTHLRLQKTDPKKLIMVTRYSHLKVGSQYTYYNDIKIGLASYMIIIEHNHSPYMITAVSVVHYRGSHIESNSPERAESTPHWPESAISMY